MIYILHSIHTDDNGGCCIWNRGAPRHPTAFAWYRAAPATLRPVGALCMQTGRRVSERPWITMVRHSKIPNLMSQTDEKFVNRMELHNAVKSSPCTQTFTKPTGVTTAMRRRRTTCVPREHARGALSLQPHAIPARGTCQTASAPRRCPRTGRGVTQRPQIHFVCDTRAPKSVTPLMWKVYQIH